MRHADQFPDSASMARCYVPLYDMLCEIVYAIKDDPESSAEMKALARRGRRVLDSAKSAVKLHPKPSP